MAQFNISPVREQIRTEMLAALAKGAAMTASELYALCPSATESTEIARIAHDMRRTGKLDTGEQVIHPLGMRVNTYCLPKTSDPRIEAAKPIKVERKIKRTAKAPKPAASNPYTHFSISKPQEAAPRVTRDLPQHLQSPAPQMAAEAINTYIEERIMSEDPIHYMDVEPFALEPKAPEAEEDIDSELIDALQGLAEFVPLPQAADDDDVLAMASADVSEIAAAMGKRQEVKADYDLTDLAPKKICKCLKINSLPTLPEGYVYGGIKVWIEAKHDVGHISISTHDEGGGPFCSLKASGHLSFDSGDLVAIGRVADALIKLHQSMDVTGA